MGSKTYSPTKGMSASTTYNKFLIDVLLKNELHGGLRDWDGVHQELPAGLPQAVNQVRKSSSSIKIKHVGTYFHYVDHIVLRFKGTVPQF